MAWLPRCWGWAAWSPSRAAVRGCCPGWCYRDAELGAFPYLGPHHQFTEKHAGEAPFLANIHCFNHAASLSIGKVAGDIPGISIGAAWLADGIAAEFYNRDIEAHWQILQDFDKPELFGDEWTDAER